MYDFIFNENDLNSTENVKGALTKTELKHNQYLLTRYEELNKLFPKTIEKNKTYHLISSDNFGSIELLKVLIDRNYPEYLGITTWSYNKDFVDVIEQLLKSGVYIEFFVDKSMKTRKSSLYAQMVNLKDEYENLSIKIHHMLHSKITILKSKDINLSIEASANYSNNQRIENFTITENKDLFNFHKKWMNEIISK